MKNVTTLVINVDPTKISKGHRSHCSGSGKHLDKRTKRLRTRNASSRAAIHSYL